MISPSGTVKVLLWWIWRIGACADSVVVSFVCQEDNGLVECDVMPVACVTFPGCGCVPCFVPDASIFGVPACACAGVSVEPVHRDCLVWRDCAVVRA